MESKKILIASLSLPLIFTAGCTKSLQSDESQSTNLPNIVLMMGDDHGWDEVGYNGHPFVKTPVLDEMASEGLRFDRFYSAHPTCSPTRGSFLTGRHPNRYGTFTPGWSMRPEEVTIADIARDAGYATAHFGKWHVGPIKIESPTSPGAMGFDEWLSHDNFFEMDPMLSRNGAPPEVIKGEGSEVIIDETIEFIKRSMQQKRPFMAVVWFGSPHEPYSGLPEDLALYDNLPDSLAARTTRLTSNETGEQVIRPLRDVLRERYAEITAMDRAIGKLRTFLTQNGIKDNTLLFYCGDNGTSKDAGHVGITLREEKSSMYDGGIRVPGVFEWPAAFKEPASTQFQAFTSDLFPTLVDITGGSMPDRPYDGVSLLPSFKDPKEMRDESDPLYFWQFRQGKFFNNESEPYIAPELQEGTTPMVKIMNGKYTRDFKNYKYSEIKKGHYMGERAMINGKYKLVIEGRSPNNEGYELYNLDTDPYETINIADQNSEVVIKMNSDFMQWQKSVLTSLTGADY